MTFAGSNVHVVTLMQDIGLRPTGQRIYLNAETWPGPVPKQWPRISDHPVHACVSIRPHLGDVVDRSLDGDLKRFLRSAPEGRPSLLGLWHEASTGGPGGVYAKAGAHVTPDLLRAAQKHVQRLARDIGANVRVGAIDDVGIAKPGEWMARDLDFYAADIYDNKHCNARPYKELGKFRWHCDQLMSHRRAVIAVTETNSRCAKRRPFWFHTVWSWLESRGFNGDDSCFLTFWRHNGLQSGDWLPHDHATINTLKSIFEKSAP